MRNRAYVIGTLVASFAVMWILLGCSSQAGPVQAGSRDPDILIAADIRNSQISLESFIVDVLNGEYIFLERKMKMEHKNQLQGGLGIVDFRDPCRNLKWLAWTDYALKQMRGKSPPVNWSNVAVSRTEIDNSRRQMASTITRGLIQALSSSSERLKGSGMCITPTARFAYANPNSVMLQIRNVAKLYTLSDNDLGKRPDELEELYLAALRARMAEFRYSSPEVEASATKCRAYLREQASRELGIPGSRFGVLPTEASEQPTLEADIAESTCFGTEIFISARR